MTRTRLEAVRKKKSSVLKYLKNDVADLLRNGLDYNAYGRVVMGDIRVLNNMDEDEVFAFSKKIAAPYDLVAQTKQMGRLPIVHFAAGGIVTPADAVLMMQLGCDGVFVGSDAMAVLNLNEDRIEQFARQDA